MLRQRIQRCGTNDLRNIEAQDQPEHICMIVANAE
jgi:hypothetical protein